MEYINLEDLREYLKDHCGNIISYKVQSLTAPGENYLSSMLKIEVKYTQNGFMSKEKILPLVVKVGASEFLEHGPMNAKDIFEKEIKWYSRILPMTYEFAKGYNAEEFVDIFPKFYNGSVPKSEDTDKRAVMILEYLKDYSNYDRTVGIDFEGAKVVLKGLAKYHSIFLAMKIKKPTLFNEKIRPITHSDFEGPPPDDEPNFGQGTINAIMESPEHAHLTERARELLNKPFVPGNKKTHREPWTVITHNDFWTNNIMIRKVNNKPIDVKIVDFQTCDFDSLAGDLMFFLFTSVKTSVLQTQLFDELIRYYHNQLIICLKRFQVKTDDFSYEKFLKEIEIETKNHQYGHATTMMNFYFGKQEKGEKVEELGFHDFFSKMNFLTSAHKERVLVITELCGKRNWI